MKPWLRSLRDSREPVCTRGATSNLMRSPAISARQCSLPARNAAPPAEALLVNMQADSEQDERPQQDRQQRGQDLPPRAQVVEVVMRPRDRDADPNPDKRQKAAAEDHERFLSVPSNQKTNVTSRRQRGFAALLTHKDRSSAKTIGFRRRRCR